MLAPLVFLTLAVAPEAPAMSDAQLDQLCAPIHSAADPKARLDAAKKVSLLGPEAYAAMVKRLERAPRSKPDDFRRLFLEMWAQLPNWKTGDPMWIRKPEPKWTPPPRVKGQPRAKRPPPHDPETLDWLAALDSVDLEAAMKLQADALIPAPPPPPGKKKAAPPPPPVIAPPPTPPVPAALPTGTGGNGPVGPDGQPLPPAATVAGPVGPPDMAVPPPTKAELETARAEAMEIVALVRAIAGTRKLEAVDPIFKLAFELDGVFRDECGRQIRSMDAFAVPALIRLMHTASTKQTPFWKQRRYAAYQLDRMDRARPQKAISAAPDDRVKAEIIHAYGEARALDAVEAILNQVDSSAHRVRKEARWAWLRYVSGKAPPPAPKRKRKLPGGKEEAEEKPDYLTYREIATLALQKQLAAINNEPPQANATAKQMTDELFDYYDKKRAAEWDEQFAAARAKEERGDIKGAAGDYGWILAHDPNYARRAEMAHAFAKYGDSLRDQGETARALGFWRQAIDLAPDGPDARYAAARVALHDGLQAVERGNADVGAFKRALALDPSLAEARAGLSKAQALHSRRRWLQGLEAAAALFGIGFLLWLLWKKSGSGTPGEPPPPVPPSAA